MTSPGLLAQVLLEVQGKRRALPLANGRGSIDAFEKACGEGR